jgi:hypothetical protein
MSQDHKNDFATRALNSAIEIQEIPGTAWHRPQRCAKLALQILSVGSLAFPREQGQIPPRNWAPVVPRVSDARV